MRKAGLGGAGLGWVALGWAGLGRLHEPQQAPCSCDQRGETGLPICSCFPQQIIPNSRTGRGLEKMGESQSPSFLLTGVFFHAIILCCLLKEGGQRRVPVWVPPHPSPSSRAGTWLHGSALIPSPGVTRAGREPLPRFTSRLLTTVGP